jgi:hypothetical protein
MISSNAITTRINCPYFSHRSSYLFCYDAPEYISVHIGDTV